MPPGNASETLVTHLITMWFKYDRDYLCVNKSQFVPVIFEPPCIWGPDTPDRTKVTNESLWTFKIGYSFFISVCLGGEFIRLSGSRKHVWRWGECRRGEAWLVTDAVITREAGGNTGCMVVLQTWWHPKSWASQPPVLHPQQRAT
jgi:hypothetical protein